MIKRIALLLCTVAVLGCSSYGQDYIGSPELLLRDPHFGQYQEQRDALELQYLHKEITYVEYMEQRDRLDARYDREVQERNEKIMSQE